MGREEALRKQILLVMGGLLLVVGCGQGTKDPGIPVKPKWPGPPYRISFDTKDTKPNPVGITIPPVHFTANPEALETRATLVIRFDTTGAKSSGQVMDQMIMAPVDISGAEGTLPADYMNLTDQGLARLLGAYCMKGKIKMNVALARSSLSPQAGDAEITAKRLSDWLPLELMFKNPHPKC